MPREKRTKPCSSCKKSKVRCSYTDSLPCERCIKINQAHNCTFVPKLPSLKFNYDYRDVMLPPLRQSPGAQSGGQSPVTVVKSSELPPPPSIIQPIPQKQTPGYSQTPKYHQINNPLNTIPTPPLATPIGGIPSLPGWQSQMENKIDSFDDKLNNLVQVLTSNQQQMIQSQEWYHQQLNGLKRSREESPESSAESVKRIKYDDEDFRDNLLTLEQAKQLFQFFDSNITPQLFGFEISKISVDTIWKFSPILICAICTIACMHHPDKSLSSKHQDLTKHLHKYCSQLLFKRPTNDIDGFNTILALIFCSFWLSDSQMFTGLALQIAKEIGLDRPTKKKSGLKSKDRLKLWYLLYVLDGQQSLTYNRQPLVNSNDYSLQHSRSLLLDDSKQIEAAETTKEIVEQKAKKMESPPVSVSTFTDMRLVSQVEYNQALTEAFQGNAWELLNPSSFGIPWKSNLELDKWMVSWTVLLAPMNDAVWSSKSTLIYYNFAKMHINSKAVRQLSIEEEFPKLIELDVEPDTGPNVVPNGTVSSSEDWEDDSDDEEFISNKGLVSTNDLINDANIAFNAAQTVLNLVLNDKDIVNNLKYVPVHVHIMLYYAALLLIGDSKSNSSSNMTAEAFTIIISNIKVVYNLHKLIKSNFPIDRSFGLKLLTSLEDLIGEKSTTLNTTIMNSDLDKIVRDDLIEELIKLRDFETVIVEVRNVSPPIYAWPGSNHGHPSQDPSSQDEPELEQSEGEESR